MTSDAEWFLDSENEVWERMQDRSAKSWLMEMSKAELVKKIIACDFDRAELLERGKRLAQENRDLEARVEELEKAIDILSARDAIDLADAVDIIVHGTVVPGAHIKQSKQLRAYAVALVGEDRASEITEDVRQERNQRVAKIKMLERQEAQKDSNQGT